MNILICKENQTLDNIGIYINQNYRNIRFLFEIDFSKDDYLEIKRLFQKESRVAETDFKNSFFLNYFIENSNLRIPFLILVIGFIRYEYLNSENKANFFKNFLKNILHNNNAKVESFRQDLINYFFRWRGNKEYKEKGLYIYDIQTSNVSIKLENNETHKYLNSFIFHSGGVSEQDLKDFYKIIQYMSSQNISSQDINQIYKNKDFTIYSTKLNNLFSLLNNTEREISSYVHKFIISSINIFLGDKKDDDFKLPRYIENYLLFIGKYGNSLEKVNIFESNFIYENQSIVFSPNFNEAYKQIDQISFKINNKIFKVDKKYDIYTIKDFNLFKVPIDNIESMFTVELLIDDNFFKRYYIDFFEKGFILLDNEFSVKSVKSKEIYIPQRDEEKKYYIISKNDLNLSLSDKTIDNHFMYDLPLHIDTAIVNIDNVVYTLYFSPNILSDIQYEDNHDFLYMKELVKFRLTSKDKERFKATDLFTNEEFNYEDFYIYDKPIGKFEIQINNISFKVIYIDGFEIIQWFNWYDNDKIIKLKLSSDNIKTNSDDREFEDDSYIHTFNLREENNVLVFNQINGNNIQLEILKPTILMSFLDKRKNETKIQSKNIRFERLDNYRQLKIKLLNYPASIKFDKFKVGSNEVDVTKHKDSYFFVLKNVKELSREDQRSHLSIVLKNDYYFLPITDIIFDNKLIKNQKDKEEIKTDDINFLMNNSDNIKYYFDNRPYFVAGFEIIETDQYRSEMLILKEARETKEAKVIKKNFRNIKEDGLYVELKDIDYE